MRSSWKPLLWHAVGLLCYAAGMVLFLLVAVGVYLAPPANSLENLSAGHVPGLLVSLGLIVLGRLISWKAGGEYGWLTAAGSAGANPGSGPGQTPDQSPLERLGYQVPGGAESDSPYAYEDGTLYVVCSECGARNDPSFSYCGNCSAGLPD